MKKFIIAIDGPSAAGKECLATAVSKKFNIIYIDTGAMYRSVAYYFIQNDVYIENDMEVTKALDNIKISFKWDGKRLYTYLNDEDVTSKIRTEDVGLMASKVSAIKTVRYRMVELQRKLGEEQSVVLDGRDVGSVVFPNADIKIFLTADIEVRARRRYEQLTQSGQEVSFEEVLENMRKRDYDDIHKPISPLVQTDDAVLIDSTNLTIEEVFEKVLEIFKEREVI